MQRLFVFSAAALTVATDVSVKVGMTKDEYRVGEHGPIKDDQCHSQYTDESSCAADKATQGGRIQLRSGQSDAGR